LPQHKSAKKRLKTAEKSRLRNRVVRSTIITSFKKIKAAKSKEDILQEMQNFFSMLDKAGKNRRANFTPNKVSNYKRKVHKLLATISA
jgi:ribosomal protein S20